MTIEVWIIANKTVVQKNGVETLHGDRNALLLLLLLLFAIGTHFPRAKKVTQIVKLYLCLGSAKKWADRLPKEWQKQTELKR